MRQNGRGLVLKYLFLLIAFVVCPGVQAEKWKTSRDAKIGIEFQHPPDWNCTWHEDKQMLLVMPEVTKPPYVGFQTKPNNPDNLPIETWYKKTQRPNAGAHLGTFAGQPAMVIPIDKASTHYISYEVARPGGIILIAVIRESAADPTSPLTLEKILQSCKLTK